MTLTVLCLGLLLMVFAAGLLVGAALVERADETAREQLRTRTKALQAEWDALEAERRLGAAFHQARQQLRAQATTPPWSGRS